MLETPAKYCSNANRAEIGKTHYQGQFLWTLYCTPVKIMGGAKVVERNAPVKFLVSYTQ